MFNPKRQVNSVIITSADIGREYDETHIRVLEAVCAQR